MRKYLLLASVAGCLMANNAMATKTTVTTSDRATINVSAKLTKSFSWDYNDVKFGNIVLAPSAADNDIIATFTGGTLAFTDGKTIAHGSEEAGWVSISSGTTYAAATGLSFDASAIDLKNDSNEVVAQMTEIAPDDASAHTIPGDYFGWYINGKLKLISKNDVGGMYDAPLTGSVTAILQF